jgi:hypothetical protein
MPDEPEDKATVGLGRVPASVGGPALPTNAVDNAGTRSLENGSDRANTNGIGRPFSQTVPPLIAQAQIAFRQDLPNLLKDHPEGEWVAYRANECLGFGRTKR